MVSLPAVMPEFIKVNRPDNPWRVRCALGWTLTQSKRRPSRRRIPSLAVHLHSGGFAVFRSPSAAIHDARGSATRPFDCYAHRSHCRRKCIALALWKIWGKPGITC